MYKHWVNPSVFLLHVSHNCCRLQFLFPQVSIGLYKNLPYLWLWKTFSSCLVSNQQFCYSKPPLTLKNVFSVAPINYLWTEAFLVAMMVHCCVTCYSSKLLASNLQSPDYNWIFNSLADVITELSYYFGHHRSSNMSTGKEYMKIHMRIRLHNFSEVAKIQSLI